MQPVIYELCSICGAHVGVVGEGKQDGDPKDWSAQATLAFITAKEVIPGFYTSTFRMPHRLSDRTPLGFRETLKVNFSGNWKTINDKYGFAVHFSCWEMVQELVGSLNPETLAKEAFRVMNSLPNDYDQVHWPHGYFGLAKYGNRSPGGGEDAWTQQDPDINQDQQALLAAAVEDEDSWRDPATIAGGGRRFGGLPLEITHRILCYLSSEDVKSARLALRSIATLELPDCLWRSMFWPDAEMGHVGLQLREKNVEAGRWKAVFAKCKRLESSSDAWRSRKRRWRLCNQFAEMIRNIRVYERSRFGLDAIIGDTDRLSHATPIRTERLDDSKLSPWDPRYWAIGDLGTGPSRSIWGCHDLCEGSLKVPDSFDSVGISYTGIEDMRFVSGIRFLPGNQRVGIIIPTDEAVFPTPSSNINALSAIVSPWGIAQLDFGSGNSKVALPRRVAQEWAVVEIVFDEENPLVELQVTADHWRLSSVVPIRASIPPLSDSTFRELNAWIPTPPPKQCALNLDVYAGTPRGGATVYNPIHAVHFGTQPLSRVTCWMTLYKTIPIAALMFHFYNGVEPVVLGHPQGVPIDFFINGEQGEIITSLKVERFLPENEPQDIERVTIYTNFHRRAVFDQKGDKDAGVHITDMAPQKGAVITGFFGRLDIRGGRSSFKEDAERLEFLDTIGLLSEPGDSSTDAAYSPKQWGLLTARPTHNFEDLPPDGILGGWLTHYSSYATMKGIRSITVLIEHMSDEWRAADTRIPGLWLKYHGSNMHDKALGQIGTFKELGTVYITEGDTLAKITVYMQRSYHRKSPESNVESSVAGIRFETVRGCVHSCGKCRMDKSAHWPSIWTKEFELGKRKNCIRWDFDYSYDYLDLVSSEMTTSLVPSPTPPLNHRRRESFDNPVEGARQEILSQKNEI